MISKIIYRLYNNYTEIEFYNSYGYMASYYHDNNILEMINIDHYMMRSEILKHLKKIGLGCPLIK